MAAPVQRSVVRVVTRAIFVAIALAGFGVGSAGAAQPDLWDGQWHYSVTPYGWLPGISLTTRYQLPNGAVENRSSGDIFKYLSGAFMLSGEARKGRWGMYGDLDWVDFSDEQGRIVSVGGANAGADLGLDTQWDLRGELVNVGGLFNLAHGSRGYLDFLFGVRYLHVQGALDWNASANGHGGEINGNSSGHAASHGHFTDAVLGLKGAWEPFRQGRVFFPWYIEAGAGDGVQTWQAMAGVAYRFGWGYLALRYRELEYRRSGGNQFLQRAVLSGPTVSATWVF